MAGRNAHSSRLSSTQRPGLRLLQAGVRWLRRLALGLAALATFGVLVYAVAPVPITPYMIAERIRLGTLDYDWTPMPDIAPAMQLAAVAAEDANFCAHWGFDIGALREAINGGMQRGGSTISQQVVKNVFLWHGRIWARKAMEGVLTPFVELVWTKRRILHVYLNVAEFGEGIFGVEAAAQHYFGIPASDLSGTQAARLAAILPDPKERSPVKPGPVTRKRAAQILSGAETIAADGRAACFED